MGGGGPLEAFPVVNRRHVAAYQTTDVKAEVHQNTSLPHTHTKLKSITKFASQSSPISEAACISHEGV